MIDKKTYLQLKKEIKCLCHKNALDLCNDMGLSGEDRDLLLSLADNKSKVQTCMELCISYDTYTFHLKQVLTKVYNYKNTCD